MAPSLEGYREKVLAGKVTREDQGQFQERLRVAADIAKIGSALVTFASRQNVNVAALTATNAVENNFKTEISGPLAQELPEEDFVQWHLEDWEAEHGPLSSQEQERYWQKAFGGIKPQKEDLNHREEELKREGKRIHEDLEGSSF